MKNLTFSGERFDTDKIISIELVNNSSIKVSMLDDIRYYFTYPKDLRDEALRDYDLLISLYNEAVTKRKNGEEIDEYGEWVNQYCNKDMVKNTEIIEDTSSNIINDDRITKENNVSDDTSDIIQKSLFD